MKSFVGIGISVFAVLGGCTAGTADPPPAPTETKLAARAAPPPVAPAAARSFRFVEHREPPSPAESPVSLTASDGTGLRLTSLRARAVVDDPLAFTELHLEFANPEDRVIEGQFRITLPEGASLSRFAMIIDGRTQEGEVVELQAARRAYEDALHRRQDPALLEQAAGNEFSARVFPIPPRGIKHLIVSYSQELRGPYRLPLRGLPELGELDIDVQRPGLPATHEAQRGVVPRADFVLSGERPAGRQGLRAGDLVVARIAPLAETAPDEIDSLVVLFDSSASRALGYREQVTLLADLIAGLAAGDARDQPLLVAAFDQDVQPIYEGTPAGFGAAEKERLLARGALGASDLGRAVRWAAEHAGGRKRVLLVSDGVTTAGELKDAARSLAAAGVQRLDALAVGGIRDEAALRALTATLPRPGAVIDGQLDVSAIAARLTRGARAGLAVKVEGAEWWFPRTLDGVQAGDEVLVYASLPSGPMRVTAGDRTIDVPAQALAPAERPLLERAAAKARIDDLVAQKQRADAKQAEALRRQITELSIRQRVISPYTALLVLETEEDYARFGIDRRALADILTVGQQGLAVVGRGSTAATTVAKRGKRRPGPEREAEEGESPPPPKETIAGEDKAEKKDVAKTKSADSAGELGMDAKPSPAPTTPAPAPPPPPAELSARDDDNDREEERVNPYTGPFREIMSLIAKKRAAEALARARAWRGEDPSDIMALIALGEALEASRDQETAARAYGSLIDLFPGRADLRRFAGQRLERLTLRAARELAVDTYARAVEQRPDHPASHRLYAFALERAGAHAQAFAALAAGLARDYPDGRFAGAKEILAEDLGLIAASWMRAEPSRKKEIRARLQAAGGHVEDAPSLRFVLVWETDANDVDFHIHDGLGGHAYYSQRELPSGGRLYEDVTTGYGPECFTIRAPRAERAYPYKLQAHYYSRGPMGYGMGKLQIIEHDGAGNLRFEERPFVVMQDGAFVDLGSVRQRS